MYINRFRLEGLKWLDIRSGISSITIDSVNQMQILTGINGGGKSALFAQLTPLPASKSDYKSSGGLKEIHCTHRGSSYVISSIRKGRQMRHSFIKDGDELNVNGLSNIQTELCLKYLGYDSQLDDLLHCKYLMSRMSLADRKALIFSISPATPDFIIDYHKRAKSFVRICKGNLAMLYKRKAEIEEELISDEEFALMKDEAKLLNNDRLKLASELIIIREKIETDKKTLSQYDDIKDFDLLDSSRRFVRMMQTLLYRCPNSNKNKLTIDEYLSKIERDIAVFSSQKKMLVDSYDDATEKLTEYSAANSFNDDCDVKKLEDVIKTCNEELELRECWKSTPYIPKDERQAYVDIVNKITDIYNNISPELYKHQSVMMRPDIDLIITKLNDKLIILNSEITHLESTIKEHNARLTEHQIKFDRIPDVWKNFDKPHTPSCDTCEYRNYLFNLNTKIRNDITAISDTIAKLEKKKWRYADARIKIKSMLDILKAKKDLVVKISGMLKNTVWKDRFDSELKHLLFDDGDFFIHGLSKTITAQTVLDEIIELEKNLNEATNGLDVLTKAKISTTQVLQQVYTSKLNEINKIRERILAVSKFLDKLETTKTNLSKIQDLSIRGEKFLTLLERYKIKIKLKIIIETESKCYADLQEIEKSLTNQYSKLEEKIKYQENLKSRYEQEILDMIKQSEKKASLYSVMEEVLSPETGLPAQQLREFLDALLSNVNFILSKVWTSPFVVGIPENGYANCDFTASVNRKSAVPINRLSKSEQAVVNFAFHIALVYATGNVDYPIFFDECDDGFDIRHKRTYLEWIKTYLESSSSPQIWMISHDAMLYTGFLYKNLICLNDPSVYPDSYVPGETNRYVEIVRS